METTGRLALPLLSPGQAHKELFHNEALLALDAVVAGAVEDAARNDPPTSPALGSCHLVGDSPTGSWAEYPGHLAAFSAAGWRFVAPVIGMNVFVKSTGTVATYLSSGWEIGSLRATRIEIEATQVVGPQAAAIADPVGGSTVDLEARSCLEQVLASLRAHGLIAT